ncbi:putative glycoside hydrolase [Sporosarcina sp. FSL K6-2383]|uniref:putative glycoside hydrolase n=1 Tax=Sporosarcina sp. FSL K6-2383 TaxID=2921556 RepID=UPI0031599A84
MKIVKWMSVMLLATGLAIPMVAYAEENQQQVEGFTQRTYGFEVIDEQLIASSALFRFDSGLTFTYPDAVRGVYVTGHSAGGERFSYLTNLLDTTDLNAMVIDIKDDYGNITYKPADDSPLKVLDIGKPYIKDPQAMLKTLEEKEIYPIARIVVFKDSVLAEKRPELSFVDGDEVWKNGRGESFVNPFMKEVWDHNIAIAIEVAKMGFQEIQFDYVRFPEGFEKRHDTLKYSFETYEESDLDPVQRRVEAITDFVAYAREQLKPYGVEVSVDIFGYAATLPEAPGIGQNFLKISENVDVISSMIYPSHWTSYFGIAKPDLEPYKLVSEYAKVENTKLAELNNPPVSRPWIQDFSAPWLGKGNFLRYGKAEVEAQIKGLKDNGIDEYLLWNAGNRYSEGVNYKP